MTPLDMIMFSDVDRYRLVTGVVDRITGLAACYGVLCQEMRDAGPRADTYTRGHGEEPRDIYRCGKPAASVGSSETRYGYTGEGA